MVLLVPKIRVVGMYIPETRDPGMYVPTTRVLGTHSTTNAADDRIQDMGNNLDEWFIMALIPAKALIDQLSP